MSNMNQNKDTEIMEEAIYLGYDFESHKGYRIPSAAMIWLSGNDIHYVSDEDESHIDEKTIEELEKSPNMRIVLGNKTREHDVVFSDITNYESKDVKELWDLYKARNDF